MLSNDDDFSLTDYHNIHELCNYHINFEWSAITEQSGGKKIITMRKG